MNFRESLVCLNDGFFDEKVWVARNEVSCVSRQRPRQRTRVISQLRTSLSSCSIVTSSRCWSACSSTVSMKGAVARQFLSALNQKPFTFLAKSDRALYTGFDSWTLCESNRARRTSREDKCERSGLEFKCADHVYVRLQLGAIMMSSRTGNLQFKANP